MAAHHDYWQCSACQRIDRTEHLWRRFAESGGIYACRGCGGTSFRDQFRATHRERMLILAGAFERYDQDPYMVNEKDTLALQPSPSVASNRIPDFRSVPA